MRRDNWKSWESVGVGFEPLPVERKFKLLELANWYKGKQATVRIIFSRAVYPIRIGGHDLDKYSNLIIVGEFNGIETRDTSEGLKEIRVLLDSEAPYVSFGRRWDILGYREYADFSDVEDAVLESKLVMVFVYGPSDVRGEIMPENFARVEIIV